MHVSKRMLSAVLAVATTLSIAACSEDKDPQAEQSFELQTSAAETTAAETSAAESSTETTQSASATPSTKNEKMPEATLIDPENSLELNNGKFRLTKDEAGPGSPEDIVTFYPKMEKYGFSELKVIIPRGDRNGIMQYRAGTQFESTIMMADLSNVPQEGEWGKIVFSQLDESGSNVLKVNDVKQVFQNYSNFNEDVFGPDIEQKSYGANEASFELTKAGKYTLEIAITIPGYETFTISQPIIVA